MKSRILALSLFLILPGCVTPPGQLTREDYNWTTSTYDMSSEVAFRKLNEGFRRCNDRVASNYYPDNKTAMFDVFWPRAGFVSTPNDAPVLGKVELREENNKTILDVGVKKPRFGSGDNGKFYKIWSGYLQDKYD